MKILRPAATALFLLIVLTACSAAPPAAPRALPSSAGKPFDAPDAAEEFARAKRLDGAGAIDPAALYRRAEAVRASLVERVALAKGEETWTWLGPGNIGGRTRALIVDPRHPSILWAGGVSGGIWKSVDEGEHWTPVGDALTNIAVNSLAMDPGDSSILFAGTGEGYFREEVRGTRLPLRGGGIWVTRNGGESWTHLESTGTPDFHWVNDLAISPRDRARIYAATRTGVWRSADAGATWSRILATSVMGGCLDLVLTASGDRERLFASCGTFEQATVYRSFTPEADPQWDSVLSESGMGRTTLAVAPSDPDVVYALSASNQPIAPNPPQGLFAVFRSDDGGDSWRATVRGSDEDRLVQLFLTNPIVGLLDLCFPGEDNNDPRYVTMGWYCNVIAVDPTDPERVWVGGVDLFRSDDGGSTWGPASFWAGDPAIASFVHADQHGIVFHPEWNGTTNQVMYAAGDGGIYRTGNARAPIGTGAQAACSETTSEVAFEPLNHDFGVTQFYHGAPLPGGAGWFGGTQDNGTVLGLAATGPNDWLHIFGGDGGYVAVDPLNPSNLWLETQGGSIARSTDGGRTFRSGTGGISDPGFLFITPFVLDPARPRRLWTGGARLWRTEDGAVSWRAASAMLGGSVSAIAVSPFDSNVVLAGTTAGRIHRTAAAGAAGEATAWPFSQPRSGYVSSIVFDSTDASRVYATYAGFGGAHVWRSLDGGVSWTAIDHGLPDMPVHSIVLDPYSPDRLYLGTDLGVWVSLDRGESWTPDGGLPAAVTEWLAVGHDSAGAWLYAFTHGRGAWRKQLDAPPRRRGVRR